MSMCSSPSSGLRRASTTVDENAATAKLFSDGRRDFHVALLSKREAAKGSLGRHWAVALLHSQGNVVLHTRNFEVSDLYNVSAPSFGANSKQLRITSWTIAQLLEYRGIVFSQKLNVDFRRLRIAALGLYQEKRPLNCQDFALHLLERLGLNMTGWLKWAQCYNSVGDRVDIPLGEKKSLFTAVKLVGSLGFLNKVSSQHWEDCSILFNRLLLTTSDAWVDLEPVQGLCCVCLESPPEFACVPCGHRCLCEQHVQTVQARPREEGGQVCPVCREDVTQCLRIYDS